MIIRAEENEDFEDISHLTELAFEQTDEARLVENLRTNGDVVLSLVAIEGDKLVGHALFSKLKSPARSIALAPVSVLPNEQKKGIGSKLIVEGLKRLKNEDWSAVFLLGDPNYYQRFGFSVEGASKFETPYPKEYFMALALKEDALQNLNAEVTYSQPFLDLG